MSVYFQLLSVGSVDSSPCVVVATESHRFLFNVGEGAQRLCVEHKVRLGKVAAVFLTSLDAESVLGLPGFMLTASDSGNQRLILCGPSHLHRFLQSIRHFMRVPENVQSLDSPPSERKFECKELTITMIPVCGWSSRQIECSHACYLVRTPRQPGKFDLSRAEALGVPKGRLYGQLKSGLSVVLEDGTLVQPEQVLGTAEESRYLAIICSPTEVGRYCSKVSSAICHSAAFRPFQLGGLLFGALTHVIHFARPEHINEEYVQWMCSFGPHSRHVMAVSANAGVGAGVNLTTNTLSSCVDDCYKDTCGSDGAAGAHSRAIYTGSRNLSSFVASTRYSNKLHTICPAVFPHIIMDYDATMRAQSNGNLVIKGCDSDNSLWMGCKQYAANSATAAPVDADEAEPDTTLPTALASSSCTSNGTNNNSDAKKDESAQHEAIGAGDPTPCVVRGVPLARYFLAPSHKVPAVASLSQCVVSPPESSVQQVRRDVEDFMRALPKDLHRGIQQLQDTVQAARVRVSQGEGGVTGTDPDDRTAPTYTHALISTSSSASILAKEGSSSISVSPSTGADTATATATTGTANTEPCLPKLFTTSTARAPPQPRDMDCSGMLRSTRLTFLGTGCSVPSKYRNVSGILLELPKALSLTSDDNATTHIRANNDGCSMLIDAGEGSWSQMLRVLTARMVGQRSSKLSATVMSVASEEKGKEILPPPVAVESSVDDSAPCTARKVLEAAAEVQIGVDATMHGCMSHWEEAILYLAEQLRAVWLSHPHADHHLGIVTIISKRMHALQDQQQQQQQTKSQSSSQTAALAAGAPPSSDFDLQCASSSQSPSEPHSSSTPNSIDPLVVIAPPSILAFLREYCTYIDPSISEAYVPVSCRQYDPEDDCEQGDQFWNEERLALLQQQRHTEASFSSKLPGAHPPHISLSMFTCKLSSLERKQAAQRLQFCESVLRDMGIRHLSNVPVIHCNQSYGLIIEAFGQLAEDRERSEKDGNSGNSNASSDDADANLSNGPSHADHRMSVCPTRYSGLEASALSSLQPDSMAKRLFSYAGGEQFIGPFKLVYSGDTRPCPALIHAGQHATVLIHEATFEDDKQAEAVSKNHSTIGEALGVATKMQAWRTVLTHFSQRYPSVPPLETSTGMNNSLETSMLTLGADCIGTEAVALTNTSSAVPLTLPILAFDFMSMTLEDMRWAPSLTPLLAAAFPPQGSEPEEDMPPISGTNTGLDAPLMEAEGMCVREGGRALGKGQAKESSIATAGDRSEDVATAPAKKANKNKRRSVTMTTAVASATSIEDTISRMPMGAAPTCICTQLEGGFDILGSASNWRRCHGICGTINIASTASFMDNSTTISLPVAPVEKTLGTKAGQERLNALDSSRGEKTEEKAKKMRHDN